ncbi:CHAT domain-containing protein [Trichocoleus sp. DQ-A3]|uniref:CHAT domain-containing protein n=1 Tax=Cyanophyceae TaxID=3028117 RepID=UPI0016855DA1|nr:CHAT domain-containing protein [Coleofasciculus sp. FACHB-125]MBD1898903.1 CHAT domain-containing protein [Coleofasciculus sp. FACHB-125]
MPGTYYNFRVSVAGDNSVRIQEWGEDLSPEEKPVGLFRRDKVFGDEEIKALIEAANQAALDDAEQVIRLGEALCAALLDDRLLNAFIDSYKKHAQDQDQLFRFELDIDEQTMPEVAALPWEFMCLPEQAGRGELWFATAPKIIFSRRRALWDKADPIPLGKDEKLRIALVISTPRGEAVVDHEPVEQALKDLVKDKPDQLELFVVNPAQFGAVDEALRKHKPHIFHFIGHGRLHNEKNEALGQLAFMNDMGRAKWINAREFSERFTQHIPGIVVLQACEGGQLSPSKAFVGVASKVVQQNIPVVVAMQYEVTNDTAIEFVSRFYWELAEGKPVDVAAQLGRRAIANGSTLHRTRDFATPVIFMRVRDGYLFQQPSDKLSEQQVDPSRRVVEANMKLGTVEGGEHRNIKIGEVKNAADIKGNLEAQKVNNADLENVRIDSL